MASQSILGKLHRKLIPESEPMQFAPYVWLVYLSIFFVSLYFYQGDVHFLWPVIAGLAIFFVAYFHAYRARGLWIYIDIGILLFVGTWMAYITPGASVFFVYAGAFCCRLGAPKKSFALLLLILLYIGFVSWVFSLHPFFYFPALMFTLLIGGLNIFQHEIDHKKKQIMLSQQEIRTLASTAERERIARDLHDTMGHTLSLLTRKSELASRLIEHDLVKAKHEINEIEQIARDSLGQIREVISGYRSSDLKEELAQAKYILESNDIKFDYQYRIKDISENISQELAVILKELVTNVLKHTQASSVVASVHQENKTIHFYFQDNDFAKQIQTSDGFGLQGIAERVAGLRGSVIYDVGKSEKYTQTMLGFWIEIMVPLDD